VWKDTDPIGDDRQVASMLWHVFAWEYLGASATKGANKGKITWKKI
jgi:hypothetical protein